MYQETPEQKAEREVREAEKEARQAAKEELAAELAEHLELEDNRSLLNYLISTYELKLLSLEDATLECEEACQRLYEAKQRLLIIKQNNEVPSLSAYKIHDEVTDEKASAEGVEHVTLESTGHERMEVDMVIEQVEKEEESYYVEPEIIEFVFAPDSFDHYEKARLLYFLPKIFSFSVHSRSWRYATSCFTHSQRAPPFPCNPQPTLFRDYTHVRGWSISDLKWPWQFKVRLVFEWCFGFSLSRQRSYTSLRVWK